MVLNAECAQESRGELIDNVDSQVPTPKERSDVLNQGRSLGICIPLGLQVLWMPTQSHLLNPALRTGHTVHPHAASCLSRALIEWIKMTQKFITNCLLNEQRKMNLHLHFNLDGKNPSLLYRTQPIVLALWKWKMGHGKQEPCADVGSGSIFCAQGCPREQPGSPIKAPLFV